jgi:hypothetical protein
MTMQAEQLKRIVDELLGPVASNLLVSRLHAVLEQANDTASLQEAAATSGNIVALFLGPNVASALKKRFAEVLR